jgi:hypothetical protein
MGVCCCATKVARVQVASNSVSSMDVVLVFDSRFQNDSVFKFPFHFFECYLMSATAQYHSLGKSQDQHGSKSQIEF